MHPGKAAYLDALDKAEGRIEELRELADEIPDDDMFSEQGMRTMQKMARIFGRVGRVFLMAERGLESIVGEARARTAKEN